MRLLYQQMPFRNHEMPFLYHEIRFRNQEMRFRDQEIRFRNQEMQYRDASGYFVKRVYKQQCLRKKPAFLSKAYIYNKKTDWFS